jgi:hypothetical protein
MKKALLGEGADGDVRKPMMSGVREIVFYGLEDKSISDE